MGNHVHVLPLLRVPHETGECTCNCFPLLQTNNYGKARYVWLQHLQWLLVRAITSACASYNMLGDQREADQDCSPEEEDRHGEIGSTSPRHRQPSVDVGHERLTEIEVKAYKFEVSSCASPPLDLDRGPS